MATIQKRMKSRSAIYATLEAILNTADRENRDLTDTETERYDNLEVVLDRLDEEIRELQNYKPREGKHLMNTKTNTKEFRNIGEFFYTIAANDDDPRLVELRTQQVGQGALGGYMLPEQMSQDILSVAPGEAVVRPRAMVIPPGDMPDAPFKISALDQGANQNQWGGFQVYHQGELKTLTESNIHVRQITLTPHKMTGYLTASNEVLRNWQSASAFFQTQMRLAMIAAEDTDFLYGDGVNKAKGIKDSGAAIVVARETASQISYTDLVNMMSRIKMGGNPIWVASQTCLGQLANVRDSGNNNLWIQSSVQGVPQTLMGYPVMFSDRAPALGNKADLMLCDFSYYLIKNGTGPLISMSEHVGFTTDEMAFRIIWYVDGVSWLEEPIPLEGATSNTISPFVVLGA